MTDNIPSLDAEIGKQARYWRNVRNLSMTTFGAMLTEPLSHQQVSKYESGLTRWPVSLLLDVRSVLNVSLHELLPAAIFGAGLDEEPQNVEAEQIKQKFLDLSANHRRAVMTFLECL